MSKEILYNEFMLLLQDMKAKHIDLGMKASGKWLETLEVQATEESAVLLGEPYTNQLVSGRKGGKFPPITAIRKWVVDKGLVARTAKQTTINSVAYLISRKIAEKGTKYLQQGGTDLVDAVITPQRMQSIIDKVGVKLTLTIVEKIENQFKQVAV